MTLRKRLGDVVDIKGLNWYLNLNGISKKRIKDKGERERVKGKGLKIMGSKLE